MSFDHSHLPLGGRGLGKGAAGQPVEALPVETQKAPHPYPLPTNGERGLITASALSWIGTPYQHQASLKGVGCDCLGLVRGVWREVVGEEPERPPPYRPDWAEVGGRELLVEALGRWMRPVSPEQAKAGDVLVFRMASGVPAKHCAILIADPGGGREGRMVHAYWGRAVVESWLGRWWRSRLAAAFSFPGS